MTINITIDTVRIAEVQLIAFRWVSTVLGNLGIIVGLPALLIVAGHTVSGDLSISTLVMTVLLVLLAFELVWVGRLLAKSLRS